MVTSIVLTGKYEIGISATGKIKTPDKNTVELKSIPFVRYRFKEYGDEELDFIVKNKRKFPCVHVVEVEIDENTPALLDRITDMDDMIAKLVYVSINDDNVVTGLTQEQINNIENIVDCEFDRIIIKDKSNSLHSIALERLKRQIKEVTGINESEIGVCGGPCCFIDGNACLTAVRSRELLAKYSDRDDVVVPSANHEGSIDTVDGTSDCVNKCGCIRYHIYNSDMPAPASKNGEGKTKTVKVKNNETEKSIEVTEKKPQAKKAKTPKIKGYTAIDW